MVPSPAHAAPSPARAASPRGAASPPRAARGTRAIGRAASPGPKAAGSQAGRAQRPPIAEGLPLQAYSDDQLDDMIAWIRSDGVQRDERSEVEELRAALALTRHGAGISAVLSNAVRRTR